MFLLFNRIAKLNLSIVPTHPDRAGGLGFLERAPKAFVLVVLAASAVLASAGPTMWSTMASRYSLCGCP